MATERPHDKAYEKQKTEGEAPPQAAAAAPNPKPISPETSGSPKLRAVFGLLIHPYTATRFDTDKAFSHELDTWCKAQLAAGKLALE